MMGNLHFKHLFYLGVLLLLNPACKKLALDKEDKQEIRVIGHGGTGFQSARNQVPHNSMESIEKAVAFYHADGVEVDIQISRDTTLWLAHDRTLMTMTDCEGCVINKSDEYMLKCRYRNDFSVNVANAPFKMINLIQLFHHLDEYQEFPFLFLDIKSHNACDSSRKIYDWTVKNIIEKSSALIDRYNVFGRIYIISSDQNFIIETKAKNPRIQCLFEANYNNNSIADMEKINADGMIFKNQEVTADEVDKLKKMNRKVALFNVKTQSSVVNALNKKPDFILTYNIALTLNCKNAK